MVTDDERSAFSRRLNKACDDVGLPPKGQGRQLAVAKLFRVTQKGARKWLEGEAIPHTKRLPQIAAKLGVTVEWLLAGVAAPRAASSPGLHEEPAQYAGATETVSVTEYEWDLIGGYRILSDEQKTAVWDIIDGALRRQSPSYDKFAGARDIGAQLAAERRMMTALIVARSRDDAPRSDAKASARQRPRASKPKPL